MAKTVLVTAGVGLIGSQLADELFGSGHRVGTVRLEGQAATDRFDGAAAELWTRGSTT